MRLIRDGGLVWGLGMYASGSTWLFNVLRSLADTLAPDLPSEGRFVSSRSDLGDPRPGGRLLLVKSHETDAEAEAALMAAATLIVVSIRDPLDVVASVMQHQRRDFAEALDLTEKSARLCARVAADPRALPLRYEAGFVDDPATLDLLAGRLDGALPPAARARIFTATRRPAVERYIAEMARRPGVLIHRESGDLLDPTTHWHSHHANRTGEVGRWRRALTPDQAAEVARTMGDWMEANMYPAARAAPRGAPATPPSAPAASSPR